MKEVKAFCATCGPVKISGTWTNSTEEGLMVPIALAPTIQALGKVYKKHIGGKFEFEVGLKMSEAFERVTLQLSHLSVDDGSEEMDKHMLQPLECWRLIV